MTKPGIASRTSPGRRMGRVAISCGPIVPSEAASAVPTRFALRPLVDVRPITESDFGLGQGEGIVPAPAAVGDADGQGEGVASAMRANDGRVEIAASGDATAIITAAKSGAIIVDSPLGYARSISTEAAIRVYRTNAARPRPDAILGKRLQCRHFRDAIGVEPTIEMLNIRVAERIP